MEYDWKFSTVGGVTRVNIDSGEDIAHLCELDQKLWTVLSCPVKGLELDEETLEMIDVDKDGKIHVNDVVATAEWLKLALNNMDALLKGEDSIPFSVFNKSTEEGRALLASAKQILANLGLQKDRISVADTSDSIAIFAKTKLNGDGIITSETTDDEALKDVLGKIVATTGSVQDRSGIAGVNAELVEKFFAEAAAYAAWIETGKAGGSTVFPYGDDTSAAWDACSAISEKISDFFMRCKLADFHTESTAVLDVTTEQIGSISGKNLSECYDEISSYPLAKVNREQQLPLNGGKNPAWNGAFDKLRSLVLDKELKSKDFMVETEWLGILAKFDAFNAWTASKAGASVESLGYETVRQILDSGCKAGLLQLIEDDLALKGESDSIDAVNRLTHLYRDFYTLLKNFVTLRSFYSPGELADFQAGRLYIDQRCCDLCIKVTDMGKQGDMASMSNMFIAYCNCVSKYSSDTMTIAAVITDGDVNAIREGKNAIFYDRKGLDWDATVIKIIDNPISVRQAFWRPYRKFGQFIENTINKFAADKDSEAMNNMTAGVTAKVEGGEKKPPFDIAKFAGIFAALGLAFGALLKVFASCVAFLTYLTWWKWLVLIAVLMLVISGPAMIMALLKLRKRNLAPVLNANGWAVNSNAKVNIAFGNTLTSIAKTPKVPVGMDPFSDRMPVWKKVLIAVVAVIAVAAAAFFLVRQHNNRKAAEEALAVENVEEVITVEEETASETAVAAVSEPVDSLAE